MITRIAGRAWKSGSIRAGRRTVSSPGMTRRSITLQKSSLRMDAGSSPGMTIGEANAPSQRSKAPLVHSGRSELGFPDPEPALWRVLRAWARAARWRCDRRLRARSLGARTGRPLCRFGGWRARRVLFPRSESLHGARSENLDRDARADQRAAQR